MKEKLALNPWLTIWKEPRKTIRALVEYDPNFRLIFFSFIYGFPFFCFFFSPLYSWTFLYMGESFQASSLPLPFLYLILMGFFTIFVAGLSISIGYLLFNFSSFLYWLVGKWLKGKGSFKEVRMATYWSTLPFLFPFALFFPLFAVPMVLILVGEVLLLPSIWMALYGVSLIWGVGILSKTLGEVQGFSAWMALLNMFLAAAALTALYFLLIWMGSLMSCLS